MARKHKHEEHVNLEAWLVSYADFITLLFAFFVVMYATSNSDEEKIKAAKGSMNRAFESLGIFVQIERDIGLDLGAGGENAPAVIHLTNLPDEDEDEDDDGDPLDPWTQKTGDGELEDDNSSKPDEGPKLQGIGSEGSEELKEVFDELAEKLSRDMKDGKVHMHQEKRGIVISLSEASFFGPGKASIHFSSRPVLDRVAESLKEFLDRGVAIRIEGHTDNVPLRSSRLYRNNLELSTARANSVILRMINEHHFPPNQLIASGYGEWRPVADNNSVEGRRRNRRVDIVILTNEASGLEATGAAIPHADSGKSH